MFYAIAMKIDITTPDTALITRMVTVYGFTPESAIALIEHSRARRKTLDDIADEIVKAARVFDDRIFGEWMAFRDS